MPTHSERPPRDDFARRLLVTVGVFLGLFAVRWLSVPEVMVCRAGAPHAGPFAMGFTPILVGYLFVDGARRLFGMGPVSTRSPAALVTSLVLAGASSPVVLSWILGSYGLGCSFGGAFNRDDTLELVAFGGMQLVGIAALVATAWFLDRHGLVNGFSAVAAFLALAQLFEPPIELAERTKLYDEAVPAVLLAMTALILLKVSVSRSPRVPLLGAGVVGAILGGPAGIAMVMFSGDLWLFAVGTCAVAIPMTFLLLRHSVIVPVAARLDGVPHEKLAGRRFGAVFVVAVLSAPCIAALGWFDAKRLWMGPTVYSLAMLMAFAVDFVVELRARLTYSDLVSVRIVLRPFEIDCALEELRSSGIPAFVRGATHRRLFHFLAPHVQPEVFVQSADAPEAKRLLGALLEPPEVAEPTGEPASELEGAASLACVQSQRQ